MENHKDQEIFENEIDQDALDVIKRLYDKTFKRVGTPLMKYLSTEIAAFMVMCR
jgi:hypothetical protein